jgi:hypothetical protein
MAQIDYAAQVEGIKKQLVFCCNFATGAELRTRLAKAERGHTRARLKAERAEKAIGEAARAAQIDASRCPECHRPQLWGADHLARCTIGGAVLCPECRHPAPLHLANCACVAATEVAS